ncbi:hypothetical protein CSB09_00520 [Candidatus Gracilibacteria bacterium]|nr:MAG: hypothetical protein CSB09_00520 [Candidatus Gracilibacteria bacterium]
MLNFAQKLMGKPTDFKIRLYRALFALFLIFLIYFGWDVTRMEWGLPEEMKYALYFFPAIGLIRAIFDPGIFRKKIWKWTIFGFGVAMIVISLFFIEDKKAPSLEDAKNTSIDATQITQQKSTLPFSVSTDNWFYFCGFILMFTGFFLNNKNITKKNEKYGEKIKTIRV